MNAKPRVAVLISPDRCYENINERFSHMVGDRLDLVMQESPTPSDADIAALIQDADAMVTGWGTPTIAPEIIVQAKRLRLVVHAQGSVKPLPYEAILNQGIILTNSARAYARTMGEAVIGMMLALGYHMRYSHELYTYQQSTSFDRSEILGIGLDGKTVGIVGLGPIGSLIAEMLPTFNVSLVAYDPYVDPVIARQRNVTLVDSIDALAQQCQILTVHCGWTEETTGLVSRGVLEQLGPRNMLICNARMPIVDEDALYERVVAQQIYAALNLLPMRKDLWLNPELRGLPNLLLTHGSSNVSDTWYDQVSRNVAVQLLNFFDGKSVSPQLTLEQIAGST
ncbi:MAG: NAD(P)-dependent oxidoreductase [bacterium]|nr:NAD(P)-dependent oxidoreductase [bacterium]